MMSLWDALRMNMMISYQELVRTFPNSLQTKPSRKTITEVTQAILVVLKYYFYALLLMKITEASR
ncbi:hypothetical protein ACNYDF_13490, partial [Klebsiella aerogenes]|uniref:hypothetical protein n=1 Tax=Klebsiella aerogenes TaxID=548 RepID=UPI003ADFF1FD